MENLASRYYSYTDYEDVLLKLVENDKSSELKVFSNGKSVLGRHIQHLTYGAGSLKILVWSQMHGNESDTTRALIIWLKNYLTPELSSKIKLYIIPVLNPDGCETWTRNNANNVDLNRDAVLASQPEMQLLHTIVDQFKPDMCFNMHCQRSIYGSRVNRLPCDLSFLAPAGDKSRAFTIARLKAMEVINNLYKDFSYSELRFTGRYDDAFNKNCIGDYLTSRDIPVILFESGHSGQDYNRDQAVNRMVDIIDKAIQHTIVTLMKSNLDEDAIIRDYTTIPEITRSYTDIHVRNITHNGKLTNLAIQYVETLKDDVLYYVPKLAAINYNEVHSGHRTINVDSIDYYEDDLYIDENLVVTSTSLDIQILY